MATPTSEGPVFATSHSYLTRTALALLYCDLATTQCEHGQSRVTHFLQEVQG